MNPAQLLRHFARISEAPDAIPRLRRFVLDLAAKGKLVEHEHANDDWLSELKRDKQRALRDLSLSRHPEATTPLDSEFHYQVPENWARLRLSDLLFNCKTGYGDDPGPELVNVGVVKVGNINNEGHFTRTFGLRGFSLREVDGLLARQNDFIIVKSSGSAENVHSGKAALCSAEHDGKLVATNFTLRLRLISSHILPEFVWRLLNSPVCRDWVAETVQTLTYPNLTWADYGRMPVALPPLAEQRRIVAKVDELMALCLRLEVAQQERETRRDRLAAASHHYVSDGASPEAFRQRAHIYLDHLPHLTTRPDQIKQLRQTILNLAVRGRLVHQDSSDEPAPSFGNIGDAGKNRLDLELNDGWTWAKVEDVADARLGKMLDAAKNSGKRFRYLRNTNVHWFDVRMDELKELKIEESEVEKYQLRRGDVLICEGGHGIGRTAVWRSDEADIVFQKALHRVRPGPALNSDFFSYCMFVYFHARVLQTYFTGVGIPHFTGKALATLVFPLPPLAEQRRIVAKVDELMQLCDRLEAQLTTARTQKRLLLEAVLHEALAPLAA